MTKVLRRTMLAVLTVAALLCLSLVFASGLNPAAAYAEETPVANAQSRATVKNIGSWDGSSDGLYQLIRDGGEGKLVSSVSYGGLMNVEQNTTIDLNGYSIIRTGASGDANGSAFYVKPGKTLTIKDTSSGGNGQVTGGNSTYGGGVWIGENSALYLLGGNISGNTAERGGGVYLDSNSTFTMSGGRVRNNTATANGGGVYSVGSGLTITISGGEITGNNASASGGGIYIDNSTLTMSGGSVKYNTAATMGGGIYASGTFYLRGNAAVTGNTVSGVQSNIYLPSGKKVTVNGQFTGSAGIYTQVNPSGASTRPIVATASSASYLDTSRFSFDKGGNYGFLISGTSLLAVQTAKVSFVLPTGVSWKNYTPPTTYVVGDGLRLPTGSNLNKPADTADTAYELSLWYDNNSFSGTRYSSLSGSESRNLTLYAKLSALTKIKLNYTSAQTHTYDGQAHAFEFQAVPAGLNGYTIEYSSDNGNNYTTTVPTNAGSYYVRIQRPSDNTYAQLYEVITDGVVIEKATLGTRPTLTAGMTYTWNGSDQTVALDGVTDGMTITGRTAINAGDYTVTILPDANHKWADGTPDETISILWGIGKKTIEPTVSIVGWTYGESANAPQGTNGGSDAGINAVTYIYSGTTNANQPYSSSSAPTQAGKYTVTITVPGTSNCFGGSKTSNEFTVARANLPDNVYAEITNWTYGQSANEPQVRNLPDGFPGTPIIYYIGTNGSGYNDTAAPTDAGTYEISLTFAQTPNYKIKSVDNAGTLTISQVSLTLTWGATSFQYTGAELKPNATISNTSAFVGSDFPTIAIVADKTSIEPGSYTATATLSNANYKLTNATTAFGIVKASITPTVEIENWTYGGTANPPSVIGNTDSANVKYYYEGRDGTTYTRSTTAPMEAGSYKVEAVVDATAHYEGATSQPKNFTIDQKEVVIDWAREANYFVYNGTDRHTEVTASYLDKDGNPVDLTVSGGEFKNFVAAGVEFTASFANSETNYALPTTVTKTYFMQKRVVSIVANDFEMYYGSAVPTAMNSGGWRYKAGTTDANKFIATDNVDFAVTTNATSASDAGGVYYTKITQTELANYDVTYADGVMTVKQRPITVTVNAATSVYGDPQATITASETTTIAGESVFVNGHAATDVYKLISNVTETTGFGTYDVITDKLNDNYYISFVGATNAYTVTARKIVVIIHDKKSVYGDTPVPRTSQVKDGSLGLVNGEAEFWTLACSVTAQSDVNTYEITGAENNPNYDVTFEGETSGDKGVYTVTKRAITVTITAKSSVYGNAHAELSGDVTSDNKIVNGDINVYSLFCDVTATSAVGKYDITGTGTDNNYKVSFENDTNAYTVTNAAITEVSATGYEGTFDKGAHDAVNAKGQTTVNDQTATWKYKTTADGEYAETMPQFTNAGTYAVWYEVSAPNHNAYTGSFEVTIAKMALDKPALTDKTYTYDKTEQTAEFDEKFDATLMAATDNTRTKAGTQNVTVTLKDAENYKWTDSEDASFTISWTINKAVYDMSGVTIANKMVNENASAQTIVISGTLPEGVTVSYSGGNQIEPGVFTVTAKFAGDAENYEAIPDKSATLTIRATEIVYEQGEGDNKEQSVVVEITSGMDPDVKLSIIDLQKDEATKVEIKRGKYGRIAEAYDLKFLKNTTVVQPDGTVTVRLLIDESMRNRNDLKVYYIDADGNVTDMNATRDGDYLVFSTTHFSTYAIAFTGLFGWEIALIVIGCILFLLLVYALVFFLLYKKGKLPGGFWDKFYLPLRKLFGDKIVPAHALAECETATEAYETPAEDIGSCGSDDCQSSQYDPVSEARDVAVAFSTAEETDGEDDDLEETGAEKQAEGFPNIKMPPYTLTFLARLIQGREENKRFYSAIKNEFLAYGFMSSVSETCDSFSHKRNTLGKVAIAGKTLKLFLALDPDALEKNFAVRKSTAKKYEKTPCLLRVRNAGSLKKALLLIGRVAKAAGLEKKEDYAPRDYAEDYPYEPIDSLIEKGLAKDNRKESGQE